MISQTLDIAISMICIILMASMLLSSLYEMYASYFNNRGKWLRKSLEKLYQGSTGQDLIGLTYTHPEIHLTKDGIKYPSYISSSAFANATIDAVLSLYKNKKVTYKYNNGQVVIESNLPKDFQQLLKAAVEAMEPSNLKTILNAPDIFSETGSYSLAVVKKLEDWFNSQQDRNTGWYKRKVKKHIFWLALVFCILFNFNPIAIYLNLKSNSDLQIAVNSVAQNLGSFKSIDSINWTPVQLVDEFRKLKNNELPFGYSISLETDRMIAEGKLIELITGKEGTLYKDLRTYNFKWHTFLGWLMGALLLMVQSSTWFDLLVKFLNIRSAGIKPISDRQVATPKTV